MRLLAFGDSITYGAWDREGGWVERVKKYAHSQTLETNGKNKLQVINLGIGGDTSAQILSRLSSEIEARYSPSWPFIFILCVGTNDERTVNGQVDTTLSEYQSNIRDIGKIAKKHTDKILFLGIPPLGKPLVEFKGLEYSDERIKQYDKALEDIASQTNITYVPTRPIFDSNKSEELFTYDNLHPNDKGHELIADAVLAQLKNIK